MYQNGFLSGGYKDGVRLVRPFSHLAGFAGFFATCNIDIENWGSGHGQRVGYRWINIWLTHDITESINIESQLTLIMSSHTFEAAVMGL